MKTLAERVAEKFLSREFPNEHALRDYLKEHPNADKSLHTVKHKDDKDHHEGMVESRWKAFKALGAGVVSFVKSAPGDVKKFITDEASRRQTCTKAAEAIRAAPAKFVNHAVEKAKREVKDYKTAGHALSKILTRKEPTKEETRALKEVSFSLAFTVAGVALTGGLAGGAAAFAKGVGESFARGVARKLAAVVVHDVLGDYPTLVDMHESFKGAGSLIGKMLKLGSEEAFLAEVLAGKIGERLASGLDDDLVAGAIKDMVDSDAKTAGRDLPYDALRRG